MCQLPRVRSGRHRKSQCSCGNFTHGSQLVVNDVGPSANHEGRFGISSARAVAFSTTGRYNPRGNVHVRFNCVLTNVCATHGSLYSLIWDFLLSHINIWTTTTWSNVWVVLPKPSWYEFLIVFLIWTPPSKYLHLTTFSNICVILFMFLYL